MSPDQKKPDKEALNREMRKLPQVEILLSGRELSSLADTYSRPLVTESVQRVLGASRASIARGKPCPPPEELVEAVKADLSTNWPGFLSPVINATGVVLHTNLGRAPLPPSAVENIHRLCTRFSVLEYDLATGKRGRRALELEKMLCALTGAESALVVNNNAAAVLLILVGLANGREAIVSRGELVQIGGGFRVPEIMAQSGVSLKEVGTTNQTYLADYEKAITDRTALLLKVHRSNFALRGFINEVSGAQLKSLAKKHNMPVVYDLGSGAFFNTEEYGMEHEPTVQDAMNEGCDVICFSGDKLFGGAQAGIIIGNKEYVDRLRKHQLLRAVRVDKMVVAALEAVALHYLKKEARQAVPVWQMMNQTESDIGKRAEVLKNRLGERDVKAEVVKGLSTVGGGSLPDQTLPTILVAVSPGIPLDEFTGRLRLARPPVVGRIEEERFMVDLRTVFTDQEEALADKIAENAGR